MTATARIIRANGCMGMKLPSNEPSTNMLELMKSPRPRLSRVGACTFSSATPAALSLSSACRCRSGRGSGDRGGPARSPPGSPGCWRSPPPAPCATADRRSTSAAARRGSPPAARRRPHAAAHDGQTDQQHRILEAIPHQGAHHTDAEQRQRDAPGSPASSAWRRFSAGRRSCRTPSRLPGWR